MKLITRKDLIRSVAARWEEQFCNHGKWNKNTRVNTEEVYARLAALNTETAARSDVSLAIFGDERTDGGWVSVRCDECKRDVLAVVQVGDEPDYASRTANICASCLCKALNLIAPN